MAPRQPRSNPQPPNRGPATRRRGSPTVPSVGDIQRGIKSGGLDFIPHLRPVNHGDAIVEKATSARNTDHDTTIALQEARDGDDSSLLPYQPTPSINPPRPRTLAAGYDPKTQTMRVRFRDGTPWEYYEVTSAEWNNFKRVQSPGRAINRTFNSHPYARGNF